MAHLLLAVARRPDLLWLTAGNQQFDFKAKGNTMKIYHACVNDVFTILQRRVAAEALLPEELKVQSGSELERYVTMAMFTLDQWHKAFQQKNLPEMEVMFADVEAIKSAVQEFVKWDTEKQIVWMDNGTWYVGSTMFLPNSDGD